MQSRFALLFMLWLLPPAQSSVQGSTQDAQHDIADAIIGKWISQDAEKRPVIFERDGSMKYGWKLVKGEWTMAAGRYIIDAKGKITGDLHHEGVRFQPWFKLVDGELQSPRDARPKVWKKEKQSAK